ncbi:MAG: MFS transporter [Actinomycetales bacterium]|nr:MFS transporter [Actinomycetales bacterium]
MPNDRRWLVLAVLSGSLLLVSLDNTIVNVALPRLQEDLAATTSQLQWVIDAYSVLFAGTLLLAGSLGDRFGRRRMLLTGLGIFIIGSLGAVISPSADALTACRALMGVGGAFIMPSTLSILVQVFPDRKERAQAIGIWAAVAGVGIALGPILGGVLLEHFSWHAIFWVNPPIAVAAIIAVLAIVPESRDASRPALDPIGAVLSTLGLVALVMTVIGLPESGLDAFTITLAVGAIALLCGFVWWERRAARPMLPMELFGNRLFSTAIICVGLVYFALMGAMFFLPQFLQLVQGMTPLQSGLSMLPAALGLLITSTISPRLAQRFGTRRIVALGLLIVMIGLASFSTFVPTTPTWAIGIALAFMAGGLGMTLPQATNGVLASVPSERAGMGSAVNDAIAELGGSFGVAILGTAMSITYRQNIEAAIDAAPDAVSRIPASAIDAARESLASASIAAGAVPSDLAEAYGAVVGRAFVSGMGWALFIGAGIVLIGALIAWRFFPERVEQAAE